MNQLHLLLNRLQNIYEAPYPFETSILLTCTRFKNRTNSLVTYFLIIFKDIFWASLLDTVPPLFLSCPLDIAVSLEKNTKAEANWTIPVASDNSNLAPIITVSPKGVHPPHSFSETTRVDYTAVDSAGNIAKCSFKIEVEGLFKALDKRSLK